MKVYELMDESGKDYYYDQRVFNAFEAYVNAGVFSNIKSREIVVDDFLGVKYRGDLYGFLDSVKMPKKYHRFIQIFNGIKNPCLFPDSRETLSVPDFGKIDIMVMLVWSGINKER